MFASHDIVHKLRKLSTNMPSEEHRTRSSKPLMEKRRRARINESLLQLKNLVLDALNKNNPRHSKLEKADILEMTVRYLRSMNRQQIARTAPNNDPLKLSHYRTGFAECMNEVSRYLGTSNPNSNANNNKQNVAPTCSSNNRDIASNQQTAEMQVRLQLMNHLASQCSITAQEATGLKKAQQQIADVALSSPSTSGVQPMQVVIGKTTASTSSSRPVQGCQAPGAEGEKRGNELNRLCNPVVNNLPTPCSRPPHVVTVEPRAYTPASQAVPMTGNEITLVLPHHLVQSGQIPTHLIPVYAASPPVCSPTTPQISPAFIPSAPLSSPSHVTLYPVAPSNVHIASPVGGTAGSVDGGLLPCSSLPIYPHESNSAQSSITLTTPVTNISLSQLHQSQITSSSSSSPSSSLSSMSSTPSSDSQATSSPPSPPPPHPPLSLGFHTPTFSPVAIALPIHARIIPASPTTSEQSNFELHPIIPIQATMATPPNHPAIPTPPNPDPQAAGDADSGREHRDVDNRGINEEVKIAPTWRPW